MADTTYTVTSGINGPDPDPSSGLAVGDTFTRDNSEPASYPQNWDSVANVMGSDGVQHQILKIVGVEEYWIGADLTAATAWFVRRATIGGVDRSYGGDPKGLRPPDLTVFNPIPPPNPISNQLPAFAIIAVVLVAAVVVGYLILRRGWTVPAPAQAVV